jgi:hypothetical protein
LIVVVVVRRRRCSTSSLFVVVVVHCCHCLSSSLFVVVIVPRRSLSLFNIVVVVRHHCCLSSSLFVVVVVRRCRCSSSSLFVVVVVRCCFCLSLSLFDIVVARAFLGGGPLSYSVLSGRRGDWGDLRGEEAAAAAVVDEVDADIALPLFEASATKRTGGCVEWGGSTAPGGQNWLFKMVGFPTPARSGAFPAGGGWGDCDGMPL